MATVGDGGGTAAADDPATYTAVHLHLKTCDVLIRYRAYAQRYIDLAGTQDALYSPLAARCELA